MYSNLNNYNNFYKSYSYNFYSYIKQYNKRCEYYNDLNDEIIIHHWQGWTDIIMNQCSIHYYLNKYKKIHLFAREDAKSLYEFIYRNYISNNRIKIHYLNMMYLDFDKEILNPNLTNYIINNSLDKIEFTNDYGCGFDEICNLKYLKIDRDLELENKIYEKVVQSIGIDYVLVMEDKNRNISINKLLIHDKSLPIFNLNNCSDIVYDMVKVIDKAKEIHIFASFWSLIIYQLQKKYNLIQNTVYFHDSIRPGYYNFLYKDNNWNIC